MLASGFSVSFYLMHKYPDYRLTISQVAGVIHAFGTFVVIFYLNPILSSFFDHKTSEENLQSLIATSILGRSLGFLIAGLLSAFFYVNVL